METKFFYEKRVSRRKMIAVGMEEAQSARADPVDVVNRRVDCADRNVVTDGYRA